MADEMACNWVSEENHCDTKPVVTLYHEISSTADNYEHPMYLNYCEAHAKLIMSRYRAYGIDIIRPGE